jgi:hypothetical protein
MPDGTKFYLADVFTDNNYAMIKPLIKKCLFQNRRRKVHADYEASSSNACALQYVPVCHQQCLLYVAVSFAGGHAGNILRYSGACGKKLA